MVGGAHPYSSLVDQRCRQIFAGEILHIKFARINWLNRR